MTAIHNVHSRSLPVPAEAVGRLLDLVGSPADPWWPSPTWAPMRLDGPLAVGADGGHGGVRYCVTAHEPGRRVEFTFHPEIGLRGTHTLEVVPDGDDACVLRHVLVGRPTGAMRLLWPLVVRSCHDAVLEHLLDNAELAVTGRVDRPFRYPWRARLAVRLELRRVRGVPVPPGARLLHDWDAERDLADAFSVRVPPGTSRDPGVWAEALFRDPPITVGALLRLRNALVGLLGIERADSSAFATLAHSDDEALVGTDAGHLDFRASVLVQPDPDGCTVTVSTVAAVRSRAGRAYLAVVRPVHPLVVRAMLRRAQRRAVAPPRGPRRRPLVETPAT